MDSLASPFQKVPVQAARRLVLDGIQSGHVPEVSDNGRFFAPRS